MICCKNPQGHAWRQQLLSAATIIVPSSKVLEFRNASERFDYGNVVQNTRSVGWWCLEDFFVNYYSQESSTSWWKDFFPLQDSFNKLTESKHNKIKYGTSGFINSSWKFSNSHKRYRVWRCAFLQKHPKIETCNAGLASIQTFLHSFSCWGFSVFASYPFIFLLGERWEILRALQ